VIKQGTSAAFNNIALIVSFGVDALYFERPVLPTDIVGVSMIIVFSLI